MANRALALRTLRRALEIVEGDERTLARKLRVPSLELHGFLMGEDTPPMAVFLSAVDVVIDGVARAQKSVPAIHGVENQLDGAQEDAAGRVLGTR